MIENYSGLLFLLLVFLGIIGLVVFFMSRKEKRVARITFKDGHLEIYGFLKNRVIKNGSIKKIKMVYSTEYIDTEDNSDFITFEFELENGKFVTLREYLRRPRDPMGDTKNFIKGKMLPTLSVGQLEELISNNPGVVLDKYTREYIEKGTIDDFVKSRQA